MIFSYFYVMQHFLGASLERFKGSLLCRLQSVFVFVPQRKGFVFVLQSLLHNISWLLKSGTALLCIMNSVSSFNSFTQEMSAIAFPPDKKTTHIYDINFPLFGISCNAGDCRRFHVRRQCDNIDNHGSILV